MSANKQRTAIIVLGMHRSGTSAMARVLSLVGAQLPSRLMPAGEGNVAGHWESEDVAEFNDKILRDLDSRWDDPLGPRRVRKKKIPAARYVQDAQEIIKKNYDDKDFIVLKDPRISVLIDVWREALKRENFSLFFVIMIRNPIEVSNSLNDRNNITRNKSLLIWATHMLAAETSTKGERRIFVKYDDLLAEPEMVLDRMENLYGVEFPRRTWESALEIEQFLSEKLRHFRADDKNKELTGFSEIERYYDFLKAVARDEPWNVDASKEIAEWLNKLEEYVGPIFTQYEREVRLGANELQAERQIVEEKRRALAAAEEDLAQLRGRPDAEAFEALQTRADELATACAQARERTAELERDFAAAREDYEARAAELSARASSAEAHGAELDQRLAQLAQEADLLRQRSAELDQARWAGLEAARAELEARARADELDAAFTQARERIAELERQSAAARADYEARAAELSARASSAEAHGAELDERLAQLAQEAELLRERSAELEQARLAGLESARAELEARARADQLDVAVAQAGERIAELERQSAAAREDYEARAAELSARASSAEAHGAELNERLAQLAEEAELLRVRSAELEGEIEAFRVTSDQTLSELHDERSRFGAAIEAARGETVDAKRNVADMEKRLTGLRAEADRTIATLQSQLASQQSALDTARTEEAASKEKVAQVEVELSSLRIDADNQRRALEAELRRAEAELRSSREQSQDLARALAEAVTSKKRGFLGLFSLGLSR